MLQVGCHPKEQLEHEPLPGRNPLTLPPDPAQPAHPLDYWLSTELARVSPPEAPSRLRQLADAQGTRAAAWSAAAGAGPVAVLTGAYLAVVTGSAVWLLVFALVGVALAWTGVVLWRRALRTLPVDGRVLISRGPGNARGGIVMVGALSAIMGAIVAVDFPRAAAIGNGFALVGAYLLLVALLIAWIIVPAAVQGRARESFRRRLHTDMGLREAAERDLATWRDPHGRATYGPL